MVPVGRRVLGLSLRTVEGVAVLGMVTALTVARAILGTVFVAAAIGKIRSGPTRVQTAVLAYDVLTPSLAGAVARWLPHVELATGVLILAGLALRPAVVTAAGLLLVFTGVVAVGLARGTAAPCGCFGLGDVQPLRRTVVLRNLVLLAMAAGLLMWPVPQLTVDGALNSAGFGEELGVALGIAVAAAAASIAALRPSRLAILLARELETGGDLR